MVILDTDVLTILRGQRQPEFGRLSSRISAFRPDEIVTTVVSLQEQFQGWAAFLNQAKLPARILLGYSELLATFRHLSQLSLLPFDQNAQDKCAALERQRLRVGTLDMRIASIALVHGAVLYSRNLRDFRKVPGLCVEDPCA